MEMKKLNVYENSADLCRGFTGFLADLLNGKERFSICLSGGNTPKALFDLWSTEYRNSLPWEKVFFYWGDERCVPPGDPMSNFGMTKKHLLDGLGIPENNVFRIHGEDDPESEAKRYGNVVPPKFDLIILGMGDDGHTASIFPEQIGLWNSAANCVVASHPETGVQRISITGKIINAAENVAFLVTGESKAEKVSAIVRNREKYADSYPAARVQPESGKLFWFLDGAAGKLL